MNKEEHHDRHLQIGAKDAVKKIGCAIHCCKKQMKKAKAILARELSEEEATDAKPKAAPISDKQKEAASAHVAANFK